MKFVIRKTFLVYKDIQIRLLFISFFYICFFVLSVALSLFVPLFIKINNYDVLTESIFRTADYILYMHLNFWPVAIIALIAICLHSIFISHKIAGPIYRFNYIFRSVTEGTLPKATSIRKGDYLQIEMHVINEMTENLRCKVMAIQNGHGRLSQALAELQVVAGSATKDEMMRRIKVLADKGGQLGDALEFFKIES